MKINRIIVAASVLVLIFGGVYLSKELGWWKTKNSGAGSGKAVIGRYVSSGESEESHEDHEDEEEHEDNEGAFEVSGSTTIKQVLDAGLSPEDITSVIGKYSDENQTVKDVATENGISFGKAKTSLNAILNP